MDFTLYQYIRFISCTIQAGFSFEPFFNHHFITTKSIILRHDVDLKPQNSLQTAIIENKLGIQGTYYFRMVPESYNINIINQIADLGHEIGYHYETMDTASKRLKLQGNNLNEEQYNRLLDEAYHEFCENLEEFRKVYPVRTICMHGSPKSKFDNRDIWKKYDYKKLGIIGEPYFDINFDEVFYLTDTGRCWNGYKFSVRDKIPQQERWIKEGLEFKTTNDIIKAIKEDRFPHKAMITIHPQRWTNNPMEWTKELVTQRVKNIVKWGIMRYVRRVS